MRNKKTKFHADIHLEFFAPDIFIAEKKATNIIQCISKEYNPFVRQVIEEKKLDYKKNPNKNSICEYCTSDKLVPYSIYRDNISYKCLNCGMETSLKNAPNEVDYILKNKKIQWFNKNIKGE